MSEDVKMRLITHPYNGERYVRVSDVVNYLRQEELECRRSIAELDGKDFRTAAIRTIKQTRVRVYREEGDQFCRLLRNPV